MIYITDHYLVDITSYQFINILKKCLSQIMEYEDEIEIEDTALDLVDLIDKEINNIQNQNLAIN